MTTTKSRTTRRKPVSAARSAAARANGRKSRGPVTVQGKYNSSLNALRHGLLSGLIIGSTENPRVFEKTYNDFHNDIRPTNALERSLNVSNSFNAIFTVTNAVGGSTNYLDTGAATQGGDLALVQGELLAGGDAAPGDTSFTMTATRFISGFFSSRLMSVVLPLPRKPVITVIGMRPRRRSRPLLVAAIALPFQNVFVRAILPRTPARLSRSWRLYPSPLS